MASPRVAVFDMNETLLDLTILDLPFRSIFGEASARTDWFRQLLQLSLLSNVLNAYADFSALGRAALEMIAEQRAITLSEQQKREVAETIRHLPPHPDVRAALERLRSEGFRLAALTNSAPAVVEKQVSNAGLRELFEALFSVDRVRRYKPAPETYRMAARELGIAIEDMWFVAAHGWDVWGAMAAGAKAGFVARRGQVLIPQAPRPHIIGKDLNDVVGELLSHRI